MGPGEWQRLDQRHIGDSVLFSSPFQESPRQLLDLGSGVGLPGIPLAILWPQTQVTLLDRSGTRLELARRAIRVLDLPNVDTAQAEIARFEGQFPAIVTRAAMPPDSLAERVHSLMEPGGITVSGGSWRTRPDVAGWETKEIRAEKLDRPVWLLIMRRA